MKKFTFDLQRFDNPTPVGTLAELQGAITSGDVSIKLTADITLPIDGVDLSSIDSLTIDTDIYQLNGKFSGAKSLTIDGDTLTASAGVTVAVANSAISSVTAANNLGKDATVTYGDTTYTAGSSGLIVMGNVVYGIDENTNIIGYLDSVALFSVGNVTVATGLTYANNKVTVGADAITAKTNTDDITVTKITANTDLALELDDAYTSSATTYTWSLDDKKTKASYKRAAYYELDSTTGAIVYRPEETEVAIKFTEAIGTLPTYKETAEAQDSKTMTEDEYLKKYIEVNTSTSKVTVKDDSFTYINASGESATDSLNKGFNVITDGYTIDTLPAAVDKIGIDTQTLSVSNTGAAANTAYVKGKYTAGYYLTNENKDLKYETASANDVTLATISGINSTFNADNFDLTTTAGKVTLKKGALDAYYVEITNATRKDGVANAFALALDSGVQGTETDANIWELNGNIATYKTVTKEYYTMGTGEDAGKIIWHQQVDGDTLGVINGIAAQLPAVPDTEENTTYSAASLGVSSDGSQIVVNYTKTVTPDGEEATVTSESEPVITVSGDGALTFTVNKDALPTTTSSVTLTDKKNDGSQLVLQNAANLKQTVKTGQDITEPAWTFNNGTGTLTATLTTGYTQNGNYAIDITGEGVGTLVTIKGLSSDVNASNWKEYIEIEGRVDTPADAEAGTLASVANPAGKDTNSDNKITITLKKAALSKGEVYIESKNSSFNYELALYDDAKLTGDGSGTIPATENVWEFSGNKAIYKNVQPEYYTYNSTTGKITYHPQEDKTIYATIEGLNSTVLAKNLVFNSVTGKVSFIETTETDDGNGGKTTNTTTTDYITVNDTTKKITLNKNILAGSSVSMTRGDDTYTLALNTTDNNADYKVTAATVDKKWWTVDDGTAWLHQHSTDGYTLNSNGLGVKYTAEVADQKLAKVTGLSGNVKALTSAGAAVTGDADTGVKLGIAKTEGSETDDSKVAHNAMNDAGDGVRTGANQTITLYADMLDGKKVTVADQYTSDKDTYQLALDSGVTQSAQETIKWKDVAKDTTTATLVKYKEAYYKKANKYTVNYYKDTTPANLLTLTGLAAAPEGLKIDGGEIKKSDNSAYITLDTDERTVTLANDAVGDTTVTLTSNNSSYNTYKLAGAAVTYTSAFTENGNILEYNKKAGDDGIEVAPNGKTAKKVEKGNDVPLFTISGLDAGNINTATDLEYDEDTKTITLKKAALVGSGSSIQLTSKDGGSYKFALDIETVPTTKKPGFSWVADGSGGVIGKKVTLEYFTKTANNLITHNAETAGTQLFKISGLNSESVTTTAGQADKDGNYIFSKEIGNTIFTVNETAKTVTLQSAALGTDDITIEGDWKFTAVKKPTYSSALDFTEGSGNSAWEMSEAADGSKTATLKIKAAAEGFNLSSDGKTLTYVDTAEKKDFLTITGLDANVNEDDLKNIYNVGTKTVTLPKNVLGTSDITLTSENGDTYTLAFANDVKKDSKTSNSYMWYTDAESGNVTLKKGDLAYFSTPTKNNTTGVITAKYNPEANMTTQFVITGLTAPASDDTMAEATGKDRDGNNRLTSAKLADYISIDSSTGKITLNSAVLPTSGQVRVSSVAKTNGKDYTLYDNFTAPVYNYASPTWVDADVDVDGDGINDAKKLQFNATTAGYKLSSDDRTLTYIGTGTQDFLTITGLNDGADLEALVTYDKDTKTVTLPDSVLNSKTVKLTSANGDNYTLALDSVADPVRTASENAYEWTVTEVSGNYTVSAKSVTMGYYTPDANYDNTFNYTPKATVEELFTITGLKVTDPPTASEFTEEYLGDYISFDPETHKVTINDASILPTTDAAAVELTSDASYTFDVDTITQPTYVDSDAEWKAVDGESAFALKLKAAAAGYVVSDGNKTLTYDDAYNAKTLGKISGLADEMTAAKLNADGAVTVDVENTTITLTEDVLAGCKSTINLSDSDYKLAVSGVETEAAETATPMWEVDKNRVAYLRNFIPEYYTVMDNGAYIRHTDKSQSGTDIVSFNGLASTVVVSKGELLPGDGTNATGNTPVVVINDPETGAGKKIVYVKAEALNPTDESPVKIITGSDNYKFALDTEATMSETKWAYDKNKGTVTITGKYNTGLIVSDDGQEIKKPDSENGEILAKITGLKTGVDGLSAGDTVGEDALDEDGASAAVMALFNFDEFTRTITFKDDTLLKGADAIVKFGDIDDDETTSNFFKYNLALGTGINPTTSTANKWVEDEEAVTEENEDGEQVPTGETRKTGTISLRSVTLATYTVNVNDDKQSIAVTADTPIGDALATVSGLKSGTWAEGTTAGAFSLTDEDGNVTVDAVSVSGKVITVKKGALPDTVEEGKTTATVEVTGKYNYTLALDPTDQTISDTAEYSNYKWVQTATIPVESAGDGDGGGIEGEGGAEGAEDGDEGDDPVEEPEEETQPNTTAYITADKTATYKLESGNKKITVTPEQTAATIATIENLKPLGDGAEDINTDISGASDSTNAIGNGVFFDTWDKVIYFKNDALDYENTVKITGESGYKLSTYEEQDKGTEDKYTLANNGDVSYEKWNKGYYKNASNQATITFTPASKASTYFTVTGLNVEEPEEGEEINWSNYFTVGEDKVVTIKADQLPTPADAETDEETGEVKTPAVESVTIGITEGYTLAIDGEASNKSNQNDTATYALQDDGKVKATAAVTAGYALNADKTQISYKAAGSNDLFTITGLNIEAPEEGEIDWSNYFRVEEDKVVTVKAKALGNSDVTISTGYTLALDEDVTKGNTAETNYEWVLKTGTTDTYEYKAVTEKYYTLNDNQLNDNQQITVTPESYGNALVTVSGLTGTEGIKINTTNKVITLNKNVVGTGDVKIVGTSDYTFNLGDGGDAVPTEQNSSGKWSVDGTTAKYQVTKTSAYALSADNKTVTAGAEDTDTYFTISRLKDGLTFDASTGNAKITFTAPAAGADFDADTNKVTINNTTGDGTVLGTSDITITGHGDYKDVKLAFTEIESADSIDKTWSVSGTTATYKSATKHSASYALDEDAKTIKYTAEKTDAAKTLVNITGLKSGLKAESGAIEGIAIDGSNKITLSAGVLDKSTVKLEVKDTAELEEGKEYGLVLDSTAGEGKVPLKGDTTIDWEYSTKNNTDTYSYKPAAAYYELNTDADTIKYVASPFVTISGTSTAFNITGDDAAAKVTAFKNFVDTTTAGKVIIKKNEDDFLTSSTLNVTTSSDYEVAMAENTESKASGSNTWTISGSTLKLTDSLLAGYTLKPNNNNYTLGYSAGKDENDIATISGLNLTAAKAAMTNYTAEQQTAIETAEDSDTKIADIQAENLATYLRTRITVSGTDITIGKDLLGTNNVTISNKSDVTYNLKAGSDVYTSTEEARTDDAYTAGAWTFSDGTATLKQTTPAYYVSEKSGSQLTYKKEVVGSTFATVKGLLTRKNEYSSSEPSVSEGKTTTNYYTDTKVVKVGLNSDGKEVVGVETTRKTRTVTTEEGQADVVVETTSTPTFEQGIFVVPAPATSASPDAGGESVTEPEAETVTTVKVAANVLGTSKVTFSTTQGYKFDFYDTDTVAPPAPPQQETDDNDELVYTWKASAGGTTANLTANLLAGYTLSGNTITYTAAKNNAILATVSGITIPRQIEGTAATAGSIDDYLKRKILVSGGAEAGADLTQAGGAVTLEIQDAEVLGKNNITVKKGTDSPSKNTYALALKDVDGFVQSDNTGFTPDTTYTWNGLKYQSSTQEYYKENANGSITYTKPGSVKVLAEVTGLRSGINLNEDGLWDGEAEGGTLTLGLDQLGTSKVTLTKKSGAADAKYNLALAGASDNTLSTEEGTTHSPDPAWAYNTDHTAATLKSSSAAAYYTLADNAISYTGASGVQIHAVISGLKKGTELQAGDMSTDETTKVKTVTLQEGYVDTSNVTITDGRNAGDYTYKLALQAGKFTAPSLDTTKAEWVTSGVNTTLKAGIVGGWELSTDGKTAQHTASSNNKALATLIFDKVGLPSTTAPEIESNVVTLSDFTTINEKTNKKVTIKTNPEALEFKFDDENFKGAVNEETGAVTSRVSIVGSTAADKLSITKGLKYVVVAGEGGNDEITFENGSTGVSVNGGAGNDDISLGADAQLATIYGDAGNDTIRAAIDAESEGISKFYGGAGDDRISIGAVAGSVSIWGDAGNDTIEVSGSSYINGGVGNDSINITGATDAVSIIGDAGNDSIDITGAATSTSINAGAGDDKITIGGNATATVRFILDAGNDELEIKGAASEVNIGAGAGNDKISLGSAATVSIFADAGADTITIGGNASYTTINAGAANDKITISGTADSVRVIGDVGDDEISITGAATHVTLSAGAGKDTIGIGGDLKANTALGATIGGEAGADDIYINGAVTGIENGLVTINAGADNDFIQIGTNEAKKDAEKARFILDTGNDELNITGAAKEVTIQAGVGNDKITLGSADTASIFADEGADEITINGAASAVTINAGGGNDRIDIKGAATNSTINVGAGNDTVILGNDANAVSIQAADGNDTITIGDNAKALTVYGGAGNDKITFGDGAKDFSIMGDAGNDTIEVGDNSGALTVYGGAGNDKIDLADGHSGKVTFYYVNGDGNDSVTNFDLETDVFALRSGTISKASVSGENLIVTVGSGKITFIGAGEKATSELTYTSGADTDKKVSVLGVEVAEGGDRAEDIHSLIYEDNNLMTPNDISELVSTHSVTKYDISGLNAAKPEELLAQGDIISYSYDKQKNK